MPLTLDKLTAEVAEADLEVHGDTLHVSYRPGVYTPRFAAEASAEAKGTEATDKLVRMVCDLLVAWDMRATADDAEPLPVTPEVIAIIPAAFLGEVLYELGRAMSPNRTTGASSGGGSRPGASQAASPIGTPSSEELGTWASPRGS